jgi:hypothetical protein
VKGARRALEAGDVGLVLPYVKQDGEEEVKRAFEKVVGLTRDGASAREVAELYFFETVVRVHRAGEGAPYTGLKPAGLDVGPVIPLAEKAIETGSSTELTDFLVTSLRDEVEERHRHVMRLKATATGGLEDGREYVESMLGLQVWAHKLYKSMKSGAHEEQPVHVD